ncbi:MAG TPA: rod shape-determining protein RodA [Nitrospiraceae bacterium]|nr:rod shape-determining protein RodA [Nitrospiraceae bacterium]
MIDRRLLKNFDWITFALVTILSLIGVMTIYSTTRPLPGLEYPSFYIKQVYWLGISLLCFILVVSIDYRWFEKFAYPLFLIGFILLVLVLFVGKQGMGAQRWLPLGPLSFQPSEFFKIFFIIAFAKYLASLGQGTMLGFKETAKISFFFLLPPVIVILEQPHLGAALVLIFSSLGMSMAAGIRKKFFVLALIIGIIAVPFLGHIFWGGLKEYQKNRIVAFVEPQVDPLGIGYHINQSKVSIGSGGFLGKGYLEGTQGSLRFLPAGHTDFIFSIFAEEWGFIGSIGLFIIYLFIFLRGIDTARMAKDPFGSFLALGLTIMLTFYFVINVGMTLGMMPVVGLPLPFMSYGGTALLSAFIAIGILINVRTRRFALFY